jgi:hypothetical protein
MSFSGHQSALQGLRPFHFNFFSPSIPSLNAQLQFCFTSHLYQCASFYSVLCLLSPLLCKCTYTCHRSIVLFSSHVPPGIKTHLRVLIPSLFSLLISVCSRLLPQPIYIGLFSMLGLFCLLSGPSLTLKIEVVHSSATLVIFYWLYGIIPQKIYIQLTLHKCNPT